MSGDLCRVRAKLQTPADYRVYPLCDDPVWLPPSVPSATVRKADGQQRHSSDNVSEGFHVGVQEKSVMGDEGGCVALCVFSKGQFGFNV